MSSKQASDIIVRIPKQLVHHGQLYRFSHFRGPGMNALELQAELAEAERNNFDAAWARVVIPSPDGDYPPLADTGTAFFYRARAWRKK